ncbi:MAG: hypothetical protein FDZ69_09020 [Deltaproteobacteria bacterium]|nr:MAG: hypothetical protein FDZ69_09020 [Deltaproteobacteria bacterium]
MRRVLLILAAALCLPLFGAGGAAAVVTGSAQLNWAEYQRDVDGETQLDMSHFFQQYSLFWHNRRLIQGGRAGGWDLGLGYEWTGLDGSLNGTDIDFKDGKILFAGDFRFTPAGLPLELHVFSRDLNRSSPSRISSSPDLIIDPNIFRGVEDGQHISSGLTLIFGGPQANLFGEYREKLAALPRLLVDYREDYVRDTKGVDPQHYRERDLAFVSLNRRNNWFHYRVFEHVDFLDEENDYEERTWLLGTVDHLNRRQWVHLTNWLMISVDGSLTRRTDWRTNLEGKESAYRLNLFSNGKRRGWGFANYTSLSRTTNDAGGIEKVFDFPVLANGEWDPQNKWKMYLLGQRWQNENAFIPGSQYERSEDSVYGKYQIESKRYPGYVLTPEVEVDWMRNSRIGDGQAARVGVELRSDNRMERAKDWLAACSAAWFDSSVSESLYTELTARLAANNRLSPTVTIGGSQDLAVGSGDYNANITKHLEPTISQSFLGEAERTRTLSGTSYRTTTTAYLELAPPAQWRNRFSVYYDLVHAGEDRHQLRLQHDASYTREQWRADILTIFSEGDELTYRWRADELTALEFVTGDPEMTFAHESGLSYQPNRTWGTQGKVRALWGTGPKGSGWLLLAEQSSAYHLYEASGLARKWLSLEQRFDYQSVWGDDSLWYASMELSAVYYVTRYLTLDADFGVRRYGLTEQNEFEFQLSAVASFRKLQANVSYAYGRADKSSFVPGVREQRWEVGLKKFF